MPMLVFKDHDGLKTAVDPEEVAAVRSAGICDGKTPRITRRGWVLILRSGAEVDIDYEVTIEDLLVVLGKNKVRMTP